MTAAMRDANAKIERHEVCVDPIFVVGAPRSGTNILARSLHRHPRLWTSGESHFLFSLFGSGKANDAFESSLEASPLNWLKRNEVQKPEFLRSLGIGVNTLFTSRSGGKRWIDHTPHYVLMADTLSEMFPGAKFLHIVRDGRRVVHSMSNYEKRFMERRGSSARRLPGWASDFREACRTWTRYVEAGLSLEKKLPERCLAVTNEDLIQVPEETFRRIFDFIGVPRNPAPMQYAKSHRLNSSFGPEPKGPPVLSDPWEEWESEQRSIFAEESGDTLVASGFTTIEDMAAWHPGDAQATSPSPGKRPVAP